MIDIVNIEYAISFFKIRYSLWESGLYKSNDEKIGEVLKITIDALEEKKHNYLILRGDGRDNGKPKIGDKVLVPMEIVEGDEDGDGIYRLEIFNRWHSIFLTDKEIQSINNA